MATAAIALALLVAPSGVGAAGPCWRPPTDAPVLDPYREPACRWCPGNRGIEYDTEPGAPVRAVTSGTVTFAGSVAGVAYLVVIDPGGRRVTYGRLRDIRFALGEVIVAGVVVGSADRSFHLGVREGDRYVDPQPLLGRFVSRPRLVPIDGGRPNPAPAPTLRCRA
ncbi:MAG: M23 family metallopeptidase [Ilumatobacteraceae bacterium]